MNEAETKSDGLSMTFPNLNGEALLVVPVPEQDMLTDLVANRPVTDRARRAWKFENLHSYSSKMAAVPEANFASLWREVAVCANGWAPPATTLYISTSGQGVPWLHVRVETTPKYYHYQPFKA